MAKRNRQTAEEAAIHAEAVRLRKMTDKQLVALVKEGRERRDLADTSQNLAEASQTPAEALGRAKSQAGVKTLLEALEAGRCKGVKGATTYKIAELAKELRLV